MKTGLKFVATALLAACVALLCGETVGASLVDLVFAPLSEGVAVAAVSGESVTGSAADGWKAEAGANVVVTLKAPDGYVLPKGATESATVGEDGAVALTEQAPVRAWAFCTVEGGGIAPEGTVLSGTTLYFYKATASGAASFDFSALAGLAVKDGTLTFADGTNVVATLTVPAEVGVTNFVSGAGTILKSESGNSIFILKK